MADTYEERMKKAPGSAKFELKDIAATNSTLASVDLTLKADNELWKFNGNNFYRAVSDGRSGSQIEYLSGERLHRTIEKAAKGAELNKLSATQTEELLKAINHYHANHLADGAAKEAVERIIDAQKIRDAVKVATTDYPAKATAFNTAKAAFEAAPNDTNLEAAYKTASGELNTARANLVKALLKGDSKDIPAIEWNTLQKQVGKEGWTEIQNMIGAGKALGTDVARLSSTGDYIKDMKALNEVLLKHHSDKINIGMFEGALPKRVSEGLQSTLGIDIDHAIRDFTSSAETAEATLRGHATTRNDLASKLRKLEGRKWIPANADDIAKAKEALVDHDRLVNEFLEENPAHRAGFKNLLPGEQRSLRASSAISSTMSRAAGEAGVVVEKSRGFFTKLFDFKRSAAYLEEQAAKSGKTVAAMEEELGKLGTTRGWKVAGAALAGVGLIAGAMKLLGANDNERSANDNSFAARVEAQRQLAAMQAAQGAGRA